MPSVSSMLALVGVCAALSVAVGGCQGTRVSPSADSRDLGASIVRLEPILAAETPETLINPGMPEGGRRDTLDGGVAPPVVPLDGAVALPDLEGTGAAISDGLALVGADSSPPQPCSKGAGRRSLLAETVEYDNREFPAFLGAASPGAVENPDFTIAFSDGLGGLCSGAGRRSLLCIGAIPPSPPTIATAYEKAIAVGDTNSAEGATSAVTGGSDTDIAVAEAEGYGDGRFALASTTADTFSANGPALSGATSNAQGDFEGRAVADSRAITDLPSDWYTGFTEADSVASGKGGAFAGAYTIAESQSGASGDSTANADSIATATDTFSTARGGATANAVVEEGGTGDANSFGGAFSVADGSAYAYGESTSVSADGGDASSNASGVAYADYQAKAEAESRSTAQGGDATNRALSIATGQTGRAPVPPPPVPPLQGGSTDQIVGCDPDPVCAFKYLREDPTVPCCDDF